MIHNSKEGREFIKELERQPKKFVFGDRGAISTCVLAFITPMWRDDESGKKRAQAHILLQDIHGRGKTAILTHLSSALRAKVGKIEGTLDMLPKDFKGGEERDPVTGKRTLMKGPLHSHVFFFDELTRTPSKCHSALLGAMEGAHVMMNVADEKTGFIESKKYVLYPVSDDSKDRDFFIVMATANPLELEGTFPLSEAHKDRFTYRLSIGLPPMEDEMRIRSKNVANEKVEVVGSLSDILDITERVDSLRLSKQADYLIQRYLDNSRPYSRDMKDFKEPRKRHADSDLLEFVNQYVATGCSPRRNYHMEAAAKAYAWINGEDETVRAEHVKAIALSTMPHVILLQPRTLSDDITSEMVVQKIIDQTPIP